MGRGASLPRLPLPPLSVCLVVVLEDVEDGLEDYVDVLGEGPGLYVLDVHEDASLHVG